MANLRQGAVALTLLIGICTLVGVGLSSDRNAGATPRRLGPTPDASGDVQPSLAPLVKGLADALADETANLSGAVLRLSDAVAKHGDSTAVQRTILAAASALAQAAEQVPHREVEIVASTVTAAGAGDRDFEDALLQALLKGGSETFYLEPLRLWDVVVVQDRFRASLARQLSLAARGHPEARQHLPAAVRAAGQFSVLAPQVVTDLLALPRSSKASVLLKANLAQALGRLSLASAEKRQVLDCLRKLSSDADPAVRCLALIPLCDHSVANGEEKRSLDYFARAADLLGRDDVDERIQGSLARAVRPLPLRFLGAGLSDAKFVRSFIEAASSHGEAVRGQLEPAFGEWLEQLAKQDDRSVWPVAQEIIDAVKTSTKSPTKRSSFRRVSLLVDAIGSLPETSRLCRFSEVRDMLRGVAKRRFRSGSDWEGLAARCAAIHLRLSRHKTVRRR